MIAFGPRPEHAPSLPDGGRRLFGERPPSWSGRKQEMGRRDSLL